MLGSGALVLGSSALIFAGDLIYLVWVTQSNEGRVNKTLEKGTQPETEMSNDKLISRPEVLECLKKLFQPDKDHSCYHVICGEHGTGKTTLTAKAAREIGKGVIYVDVPANFNKLGEEFGKALNFTFDEDAMLTLRLKRKFFGVSKGKIAIYFIV